MAQFCAHCGILLHDEGAFCHGCGKPKVEAATLSESAAAPSSEPQEKGGLPASQVQHTGPQPTPVAVSLETPFGQVFSVTSKVILALFVISLGIGFVYLIINALGKASDSARSGDSDRSGGTDGAYSRTYLNSRAYYDKEADAAPTAMPLSKWKTSIAADIAGHCIREGMTFDEVKRAIGEPTSKEAVPPEEANSNKGEAWQYVKQVQLSKPCSKYEGDKCADPVEYETEKATLYFSPTGHLTYPFQSEGLKPDLGDKYSYCH